MPRGIACFLDFFTDAHRAYARIGMKQVVDFFLEGLDL